ncbi:hypothetical protein D3C81_1699050 [compost metagenome]
MPLAAIVRILPLWMNGSPPTRSTQPILTMPVLISVRIGAMPLYGTCWICMPVCAFSHSIVRWPFEPMPQLA